MTTRESVRLVEVGARDGLQNEPCQLSIDTRVEFLERLADTGIRHLEAGAFVSPRWVPQMQGSDAVLERLKQRPGYIYSALVPNLQGFEQAAATGIEEISVFTAASESFARHNINCSIDESLDRFEPVIARAHETDIRVRGCVSCALGCPYSGAVAPEAVATVAERLFELGCYEISLGDTIGVGTPRQTRQLIQACAKRIPISALAGHFHDTWNMALVNVLVALEEGVRVFDGAVSALGGCPYAPGAGGNVATEALVYLFEGEGFKTGVNLERLVAVGSWIDRQLNRQTCSSVAKAIRARVTNRGNHDQPRISQSDLHSCGASSK